MKRRDFIKLSSTASVAGIMPFELSAKLEGILELGNCDIGNRKLILINLSGGNDGLNTVIPINQYDLYSNFRPTIRIPDTGNNSYILLDSTLPNNQQIGLHPSLIGFKSLYDEGYMRIVQSVGYPSQNRSHFASDDLYMTGNDGNSQLNGVDSGWIGRFMENNYSSELSETYPLAVQIGSNKTSLGFKGQHYHSSMVLNIHEQDPSGFYSVLSGLSGNPSFSNSINSDYGVELEYIRQTDLLSNSYAQSISSSFNSGMNSLVTYPNTDFANQLKTVARLISGGLESKVYMVELSKFDTHDNQLARHTELLTTLSEAINAFISDVNSLGIGDDITAITYSEFGRKVKENGNGTDHGDVAPMFVFGKPVAGGVSGVNPDLMEATSSNNYQIETVQYDYREVIGTLLQDFIGGGDSLINTTFFDYNNNTSFVNSKLTELINNDYKVDYSCYTAVLNKEYQLGKKWIVYPNSFEDKVNLRSMEIIQGVYNIKIYSRIGKLVYNLKMKIEDGFINLDLSLLKSGLYLLSISDGQDNIETHQIIKK